MHENVILPCIFGCAGQEDRLSHYMHCITMWSILNESFGGIFAPSLVSRLGYQSPCPQKFIVIACAFEVYHALKVGNRSIVEECVASCRFAKVVQYSSDIAADYRKRFALHLYDNISHHDRSNVGALPSHPRRKARTHVYRSSMSTPARPRSSNNPVAFTNAVHTESCPSSLGVSTATDLGSDTDLDA